MGSMMSPLDGVGEVALLPCCPAGLTSGEMSTDRINHSGLLTNQQMPRAVEHQAALLFGCLGSYEPHVCPGDRFADRLSIGSIVLLALHVRLHIGRRHQPYHMP
jgi:hypothetical protein